jgi:2-haloacid dehalogenase
VNHDSIAIALDVYGTIVDPYRMAEHLRPFAGERADRFADLWREKQLEYSFRRALMNMYEPFSTCTRQALAFAAQTMQVDLTPEDQADLMERYKGLPAFPEAETALRKLRDSGTALVAFSNGQETAVSEVLRRAGLLDMFNAIVSVDAVKSFKPAPSVYRLLIDRLERPAARVWLVSSNSFDVIGAKACGLHAAWIRRPPGKALDPWGIEPDLIATDLLDCANLIQSRA